MAQTVRIGVLNDMGEDATNVADTTEWVRREIDKVRAAGRLTVDVEIVHANAQGLPAGTAEAVEKAFYDLARQDVVMIVGPAIGDNALDVTPLVERERIPTINWAGAERARGEYMFHLQVGSHEDEALMIARYFKANGIDRVGVVFDVSPIGTRYLQYLEDEARIIGLEIVATEGIGPLTEDASDAVGKVLAAQPQGFAYLGLGIAGPAVSRPLAATGWQGPRAMNTAGLWGYKPEIGKDIDGWVYVDMHSDRNEALNALRPNLPPGVPAWSAAKGFDIGRLVAEGLARSTEFTRDGVKKGLEQVKWLAAAEGEEGTLLGFGIQDRGALHGRYMVMRQWLGGKSVEVS